MQPASTEPYGASNVRRRTHDEGQAPGYQTSGSSYTGLPHAAGYHPGAPSPLSPPSQGRVGGVSTTGRYKHNRATALVLLPPLLCLVLLHPTPYPLVALLFSSLMLYALDLANSRDGTALGIWVGFAVTSGTLLSGIFDDASGGWGLIVTSTGCSVLLLFCVACWSTLQFQWLYKDTPSFAVAMERMLHSILPLASASVMTYHITSVISNVIDMGVEVGAAACPFIFLFCLVLGISVHGTAESSFRTPPVLSDEAGDGAKKALKTSDVPHAVAPSDGGILSATLILLPPVIHVFTFRQRIVHSLASWDDGLDLTLILTAPYVVHYVLVITESIWWAKSLPFVLRTGTTMTLRGAFFPILFSLVSSVAFQLRFVQPICASVSYMLNGHETQSAILTTICLTTSTLSFLGGVWFYGRKDQNNELLFGEMHEDVFQGFLAVSGLLFGMALGMPWRLLPLPSLCFLAVAIYVATRMFRYYAVLLFVIFSASSFFIQYRFLYIQQNVDVFGMSLTLNRFGMGAICVGLIIASVVGLVFRAADGWGAEYLKKIDLAGIVLSTYAFLIIPIEAVLLKSFIESSAGDEDDVEVVGAYKPYMAFVSGTVLLCISWHLKRSKCIKAGSAITSASASIGKMLAVVIDGNADGSTGDTIAAFLFRALVTSLLLITVFAPYGVLTPVHARSKRTLGPSGKPIETLPGRTEIIVFGYCAVVLPVMILISIPTVLKPVIGLLRGSALYYRSSPALSEMIGFACSIWGVASMSMINYLLPAGGAYVWRKAAALMFFLGLGISFAAPSLPWANDDVTPSSAFATVSSLGLGAGQGRSGGWGLVSASLAILLALTGPLELKERKDRSGLKDQSHLLRLMLFSIMFGCGISWFIVIQSMGDEPFLSLFMTATSCMATAFLGTVTCVLGYSLESQNFDEVQQIAKVWIGSSPIFLIVSGVSTVSKDGSPPFGLGGWLSTYLSVFSLTAFALAIAVASRDDKTSATRGLGNLSCLVSWACAVACVYGQFGLAGIGVPSGSLFGIPVSVIGTFVVAPVLLMLEGETPEASRRTYSLSSSERKVSSSFGVNMQTLTRSNRLAPPLAATVLVFLCAALYAILLRGCGWLIPNVSGQGNLSNIERKDVFSSVYAFLSKTKGITDQGDVATMAQKNLVQSKAVAAAAKLAGSGFWTSQSMFGPLLHLAGVVAVIPSLYCLVTYAWTGTKQSVAKIVTLLPLNIFPFVLCRGIPSLWAAALVGLVGGTMQILLMRQSRWVAHMRM